MDKDRLTRRVEGRNHAKTVLELVQCDLDHPDKIETFLGELEAILRPKPVVNELEVKRVRERTIQRLSAIQLTFGIHAGEQLDEIPRDYLEWLLESSEQVCNDIRDYLEATEIQNEDD